MLEPTLVEVPKLPNYKRIVHWTTCTLHQYFTKYKLSEYVIVRIYHSRGKTQYFRYLPYSYRAEVRATVEIHYCKPIKRNIDARISFVFQESKKHPPPLIKSVLNFIKYKFTAIQFYSTFRCAIYFVFVFEKQFQQSLPPLPLLPPSSPLPFPSFPLR